MNPRTKKANVALTETDVRQWRGQNLVASDGDKIGKIEEIYLDAETDVPEWALVTTGMFGTKQSFVPIQDASAGENGDGIRVPFDKQMVKDAPKVDRRPRSACTRGPAWRSVVPIPTAAFPTRRP
jgi:sporulation protein YlmC with PRC-barrel domain